MIKEGYVLELIICFRILFVFFYGVKCILSVNNLCVCVCACMRANIEYVWDTSILFQIILTKASFCNGTDDLLKKKKIH